jgi:hypothetical protein
VLFGLDILPLTPIWERDNPIVLVPFHGAMDLCRQEGCEKLAVREALRRFDDAVTTRAMSITWEIRDFLSHARLSGLVLCDTKDSHLVPIVRRAIERDDIVGLRKGEKSKATHNETAEQRQLVRKIEQIVRTSFSHSGRQYRLVVDVDLAKTPSRDSYEVVDHDDAKRVLDGVAKQSGIVPELTALLGQAREKLTRNWHPPLQPDGLILLRRIRQSSAFVKDTGPAITPSQMAKLLDTIEISLVDGNGEPMAGEAWEIVLPDGSKRSGQLDESGRAAVTGIPSGNCSVTFPQLDPHTWSPSGSQPR